MIDIGFLLDLELRTTAIGVVEHPKCPPLALALVQAVERRHISLHDFMQCLPTTQFGGGLCSIIVSAHQFPIAKPPTSHFLGDSRHLVNGVGPAGPVIVRGDRRARSRVVGNKTLKADFFSILYGSSSMLAGLLSRVDDAVMGSALAVAERGFGIASRIVPSATVTILVPSGSLA